MKRAKKKAISQKGETLIETLVTMLMISIASALLATMLNTAFSINRQAKEKDSIFYEQMAAAEKADADIGEGRLTATYGTSTHTFSDIKVYGTVDGIVSYGREATP